ncbi:MAG: MarR family transcriptional regulator [Actinobacteria bacterium]|nr:MarR family transcriptional regulator [Actinomycetota bacterium]
MSMDLFDLIVRLETDLWNLAERELHRAGQVGLGVLSALRVLDRLEGSGRVQDLSRDLSITIGAASKLVDRIERDALAARRPHPDDRRSSLISLTAAGREACREGEEVVRKIMDAVIGDSAGIGSLSAALDQLVARVGALGEEVSA